MSIVLLIILSLALKSLAFHPIKPFKTHSRKNQISTKSKLYFAIDPNYNLAAGAAVIGTVFGAAENVKGPLGKVFGAGAILFTLFGGFVAYQTTTLRFTSTDESFALVKADGSSIGENVVVGGENSWKYKSFVNYAFLPSEDFPILVYFKETQTPEESRVDAPIVVDNLNGQAHFFPAIANVAEIKAEFDGHGCPHE